VGGSIVTVTGTFVAGAVPPSPAGPGGGKTFEPTTPLNLALSTLEAGSVPSQTEKSVPLLLDVSLVDRFYAEGPNSVHSLASLPSHENALASATDQLWDWLSNDAHLAG
jgi:hypothetical protein